MNETERLRAERLGRVLASLRLQRGLTQGELAARIGQTDSSVSKYEAGLSQLALHHLFKIADALGTTPSNLVMQLEALEP